MSDLTWTEEVVDSAHGRFWLRSVVPGGGGVLAAYSSPDQDSYVQRVDTSKDGGGRWCAWGFGGQEEHPQDVCGCDRDGDDSDARRDR